MMKRWEELFQTVRTGLCLWEQGQSVVVARSFSQRVPAVFQMAGASVRVACQSARPLVLWLKAAITARESQTVAD